MARSGCIKVISYEENSRKNKGIRKRETTETRGQEVLARQFSISGLDKEKLAARSMTRKKLIEKGAAPQESRKV